VARRTALDRHPPLMGSDVGTQQTWRRLITWLLYAVDLAPGDDERPATRSGTSVTLGRVREAVTFLVIVGIVLAMWNTPAGFEFTYSPFVVYRWFAGSPECIVDHVHPGFAILETLGWLAGVSIFTSGQSRPRWALGFIYAATLFPFLGVFALVGRLYAYLVMGSSAAVVALAVVHRVASPSRVRLRCAIELVVFTFAPILSVTAFLRIASLLFGRAWLLPLPFVTCLLLCGLFMWIWPRKRPWFLLLFVTALLAALITTTQIADFHERPPTSWIQTEEELAEACRDVRSHPRSEVSWYPISMGRPYSFFHIPVAPAPEMERFLVFGSDGAFVLDVAADGSDQRNQWLDWPWECLEPEHVAVDVERNVGIVACHQFWFVLFDLSTMEQIGFALDWAFESEPLDVAYASGRCELLAPMSHQGERRPA